MVRFTTTALSVTLSLLVFLTPVAGAALSVEPVISGLDQPVRLVAPAGDSRLFVVERGGKIRVFDQAGSDLGTFLDIGDQTTSGGERGLLGLAFAPDYAASGRFYINFTDRQGATRIARYRVSAADPDSADRTTQEIILTVAQPFSNHNGGHLEFGPDGLLYIGLGDGGSGGDPGDRAQNPQLLLGKMLRLDVGGPTGYAIPADNPFVGRQPRSEIWALGLRNPWCFSFDRATGDLYIADVGQGQVEEIDFQAATATGGANYGWRLMEGDVCFEPATGCAPDTLTLPVYTYTHGGDPFRCSISGGYVYRGSRAPSLSGLYLFGDFCSHQIWSLDGTAAAGPGAVIDRTAELTPAAGYLALASFGQDGQGEIYTLDLDRGTAYRIVEDGGTVPALPTPPYLGQNAPNPFNPGTEITFAVPVATTHTTLAVYDVAGRRVRTLVDAVLPAGLRSATWDGTDDRGRRVASGVYLYRLAGDGFSRSRKMLLLE